MGPWVVVKPQAFSFKRLEPPLQPTVLFSHSAYFLAFSLQPVATGAEGWQIQFEIGLSQQQGNAFNLGVAIRTDRHLHPEQVGGGRQGLKLPLCCRLQQGQGEQAGGHTNSQQFKIDGVGELA